MNIEIEEPLIRVECLECNNTFFPVNCSFETIEYCAHCGSDSIEEYEETLGDDY